MSKLAVVYCSNTGNTKRMAEIILKGVGKVSGMEGRAISIEELSGTENNEETAQFLKDASCMIFGSPVVLSTLDPQARKWLMSDAANLSWCSCRKKPTRKAKPTKPATKHLRNRQGTYPPGRKEN